MLPGLKSDEPLVDPPRNGLVPEEELHVSNGRTLMDMRRWLAIASLVAVVGLIVAAPALAQQRDPFDPVIEPQETVVATGEGGTPEPGTTPAEDTAGTEQLPNTGGDPNAWLVAAFVLIALGAGVVVVAKSFGPAPPIRRR
jgi:LPXTG-motif cell wall-anchored protein